MTLIMRPYLAIIKDSFREALASRVLWVLLALITVTLLAFAPLTYREEATVGLRERDVEASPLLAEELRKASAQPRRCGVGQAGAVNGGLDARGVQFRRPAQPPSS